MRKVAGIAAALAVAACVGVSGQAGAQAAATKPAVVALGVYEPNEASTWAGVTAFGQRAGQPVRYVEDYVGQGHALPSRLLKGAAQHGTEPVFQLLPASSSRRRDAWLAKLAKTVHAYHRKVILSWMPEANGRGWSWWQKLTRKQYVASWDKVRHVFRADHNVTWMVIINRTYSTAAPTSEYASIPGVKLIGIDAYYEYRQDTFSTVFGATIRQIRAVTNKPILISETAAGQVAGQARSIPGLVRGVRSDHLAGLIWFNDDQNLNIYHQRWALTAAGFRALRQALR